MIVTRAWLSEFIDISEVSNDKLYETFNSIGLEVDSIKQISIAQKVVIGEVISCEKHPDADKLNVCQIDIGSSVEQIVCGASNVVDAKYVAVATVGAVLPGDFAIKPAKLRGVDSNGMVCASSELGLPDTGKGIMILDDSIGELKIGEELSTYSTLSDTIIELELTANRGDCLSIYGVARDLSVALDIKLNSFDYKEANKKKKGIAREAELRSDGEIDAKISYKMATVDFIASRLLTTLRLAMVNVTLSDRWSDILAYTTHATGVIIRAYDSDSFKNNDGTIIINPVNKKSGINAIYANDNLFGTVGANQTKLGLATQDTQNMLIEATYIAPDILVEALSVVSIDKDELYYKTSRGSNPDLYFGFRYLSFLTDESSEIYFYENSLDVENTEEIEKININIKEISDIIGMDIELERVLKILQDLGFTHQILPYSNISIGIPEFRPDIKHTQDITEEIVRMIGINNIPAKPFEFKEKSRLNATTSRYSTKKEFRNRAVGVGFYENISYVFADKSLLLKYGFDVTKEELELVNPIVEELNVLRSTILINLLLSVKKNVSHNKKSIPLFEIGSIFGVTREQKEVISFVFSGDVEADSIVNAGKPKQIDFEQFSQKLSLVIGPFELLPCSGSNGLIHPYQSADILVDGKVCGFLSKLHPTVQEEFGINNTFIAEIDFDALLPKHINVKPISKFQGSYRDLSIVIDKDIGYFEVSKLLNSLSLPLLREIYPVDIYEDEKLGDKKSLTIRLFAQSMERTLEDKDIEEIVSRVMALLEIKCKAELR